MQQQISYAFWHVHFFKYVSRHECVCVCVCVCVCLFAADSQLHTYEGHTADVKHLLVFGPHLISIADDQTLRMWDLASGESAGVIELPPQDRVTALMHPDTYLNKVIVAYASGTMELWNLRTASRIHRFAHFARPAAAAMEVLLGTAAPTHATASILCVVQVCARWSDEE
jgi:WD40 repeat protein